MRKQDTPMIAEPFVKMNFTLTRLLSEIGRDIAES
jgi:hypothetical protein